MSDHSTILAQARESIESVKTVHELEQLRAQFLGKKSILNEQLKQIAHLSPEEKRTIGQAINQAKNDLQALFQIHLQRVQQLEIDRALNTNKIDVTLAGRGQSVGRLHPVTQTRQWIEDFFTEQGFEIVTGPEIEDEYHNFSALNIPDYHPAREMHDTFYFDAQHLLRTHTSPVQIRAMKTRKPPFRLIAPGRVYRCDFDVTHTPMFHQVEGMMVDEHISFADLKGVLTVFLQQFFQSELGVRFRPAYFPFTEPSAEVDISCVQCAGKGCRVCKQTGWMEILGCGMIHPRVLEAVSIDSKQYHGFAFGMGVDRLTMLKYGIPDLRSLFENDLRLLQQF